MRLVSGVLVAVVGLAVAGCGEEPDPREDVAATVRVLQGATVAQDGEGYCELCC